MNKFISLKYSNLSIITIYLVINIIFIYKYTLRTPYNPYIFILLWLTISFISLFCISYLYKKITKSFFFLLLTIVIAFISLLLWKIDPLQVNVDRWSATSFFLDGLFHGQYPYGIHTHVSETNYPSPFPLWQYINIPFWLIGDVGYGLPFFLLIFLYAIYNYYHSYGKCFVILFLLTISPAYWWEVVVRSDGLSNSILVFSTILWMQKNNINFSTKYITSSILCGLLVTTRLSAIPPLIIFQLYSWIKADTIKKINSFLIVISIPIFLFLPYILWDTETWIFFQRNPFISQTSTGSPLMAIIWIIIILLIIFYVKYNFYRFIFSTASFIFIFFLVSITLQHFIFYKNISVWQDADFDISYFTLSFPYCIYYISIIIENKKNIIDKY